MRSIVRRPVRSSSRVPGLVRILAVGLVGAGLSGCASSQTQPNYAGVYQPPAEQAAARVAERPGKVDVEADGKPAQLPPARRPLPEEDDPSQPWSPNYGKKPGTYERPVAPPARSASLQSQWSTASAGPAAAERPSRPMKAADADAIVLRAIQNHEVRRP